MSTDGRIHEKAAAGFARGAEEYERGRPGFPDEVVATLLRETGLNPATSTAVDLGAGTGKLTRDLVAARIGRVVAVEPVAEMRVILERVVPEAEAVDGTGEEIPLPDGSADLVTAAQALHWFDANRAFDEIHRVLRRGRWIAAVWNTRDEDWPSTAAIDAIIHRHVEETPQYRSGNGVWERSLAAHSGFGERHAATFPNRVELTVASMRDRISSTSYVSALPDDERLTVLDEVEGVLRAGPVAEYGEPFFEVYRTELFWWQRMP